jgi:hypothetical protein
VGGSRVTPHGLTEEISVPLVGHPDVRGDPYRRYIWRVDQGGDARFSSDVEGVPNDLGCDPLTTVRLASPRPRPVSSSMATR